MSKGHGMTQYKLSGVSTNQSGEYDRASVESAVFIQANPVEAAMVKILCDAPTQNGDTVVMRSPQRR